MSAIDRITMNPDVCSGRPCIRGLRIRAKDVLDLMAVGATREEVLETLINLTPYSGYPTTQRAVCIATEEFAKRG